jgi:hypothetical protein
VFGPGAYRPDPTEGMTAIADLPQPEIVLYSRNDIRNACPRCGHVAYRDKQSHRTLHDLGNLDLWCPRDLVITYFAALLHQVSQILQCGPVRSGTTR